MEPDPVEVHPNYAGVLVGASAPMQRVVRLIHQVAAYGYPVFVPGERGSGRELVARTIHSAGPRRDKPFVILDCSILAPTLLRAELFGYGRGAFLGASESKWGILALAGQGTVFLDQIQHVPVALQTELMRVLQHGKFTPVGSTYPMPFKARVIAGSSTDLVPLVKTGTFREDFYLAINVRQIQLPPLRARYEDIATLADHFLNKYRLSEAGDLTLSDSARRFLESYHWPGNVRELENTIKRAVAGAQPPLLRLRDVRLALRDENITTVIAPIAGLPQEEVERQAIVKALRDSSGDPALAAHRLGMGKAALSKRLRYHGLSGPST